MSPDATFGLLEYKKCWIYLKFLVCFSAALFELLWRRSGLSLCMRSIFALWYGTVGSYCKYISLVHVDLGDSRLLTIVEVQQEV